MPKPAKIRATKKSAAKNTVPQSEAVADEEEDKRPPYPTTMTCACNRDGGTPEWEWEFESTWTCIGCGTTIETPSDAEVLREKQRQEQVQAQILKLKNLKRGDQVAYKNSGFGAVSYEGLDTVTEKKRGKLFTKTFNKDGLEWTGSAWKFDGGLGLVTTVVLPEEVPQGALAQ